MKRGIVALAGVLAALSQPRGAATESVAEAEWAIGMEELHRLDLLPSFKRSVKVASVSSYDRTGGNDDGFSGKYSFVAKETAGLVLADLKGPGVVYRIWTPTPSDDLFDFYFDGEEAPRIKVKFREIFMGKEFPFLAPLAGYGAGGFYSYVPLPFAKSLKLIARAQRVQFYQINYALYPDGAPVKTFEPRPSKEYLEHQEKAQALFSAAGTDVSRHALPPGSSSEVLQSGVRIDPGRKHALFQVEKPGRLAGLRLAPASALAGKDRGLVLNIYWDGEKEPSVSCPAGDFFGHAWGEPAVTSLLLGTAGNTSYCYFPMPFDKSAVVELVSERTAGPAAEVQTVEIQAEAVFAPVPRRETEGRFHAVWRRENPTKQGAPFTFVDARGKGHLVGCILQSQGFESGKTLFFEGDDQTTIDGELVIHGTGSEDFFNGGWYDVPGRWEGRLSFPLSGCLDYRKELGRTGGHRLMIGDAYAYRKSLLQTIEHAGTDNNIPTDYCAVTFLYSEAHPEPGRALLAAEARKVVDPGRIIFAAWWQVPIHAFSFQNGTLARKGEKIGSEDVRFLSLEAQGEDWFGQHFLCVTCNLPAAGKYAISVDAVKGPKQGRVQLFDREAPVGEPADLFSQNREKASAVPLGALRLSEGKNNVMLKLVGKNEKSSGLGLDLIHLIFERDL